MLARAQSLHADPLALQVADAADAFVGEQLEAAGMHAGQHRDRLAGIDRDDERRRKVEAEIDLAARDRVGCAIAVAVST